MVQIPLWILVMVGVIGIIFITPYRAGLINLFSAIYNIICGLFYRIWAFICGATPVATAVTIPALGWIGGILLILALIIIVFVGGLYFMAGITILTIGGILGHWQVAFWALLALLIWGSLSVLPRIAIFRPLNWISCWIARPMTIILFIYLAMVCGWWAFGNLSPQLQSSIGRSGGNKVGEISNSLDKNSMKSEPEMGTFAKVLEDSQIYNQSGQAVFSAQRGTTVLVKNLNGQKANADVEGMTKIMLPNRHGDFQQGNEGWIPTRKLDWSWQAPPAPTPAPAPVAKSVAPPTVTVTNRYVFTIADNAPPGMKVQAGEYRVEPSDALLRKEGGKFEPSNGSISVPRDMDICGNLSGRTGSITLTRK